MELPELGWSDFFIQSAKAFPDHSLRPARVNAVDRGVSFVWDADGEWPATVPGRFRHLAQSAADYPVTGDWVLVRQQQHEQKVVIEHLLPRRTEISRTVAGGTTERQVLAANVDTVFVVASLGDDLNPRRIERYLTTVWEGGAQPVLLLTKTDLCEDLDAQIAQLPALRSDAPVVALSSVTRKGLKQINQWVKPGSTCAMIGPSGVGKSTLINALYKEDILDVLPVREKDQKGRHTTTRRELIFLPNRALIIDTPGLRELQLWEGQSGLIESFADVEELANRCRFTNCQHQQEPGCAVRASLERGELDLARFQSFLKLRTEIKQFESRRTVRQQADQRKKSKAQSKILHARLREKGRVD